MMTTDLTLIRNTVSGEAAKLDVAELTRYHRIQASPGYREAAHYVEKELYKAGIDAWIESFPADERTRFLTDASFQEWNANSAVLHLVEPAGQACKLADFREVKTSLIQRSASFKGQAEVVLLEDGLKEKDYQDVDVAGKVVLTKGEIGKVQALAVQKYGAVGILFYGMRSVPPVRDPMDLPDSRQYSSFWWRSGTETIKCFGFVLTPRQGKWLCNLVRQRAREGNPPVKVEALVDSQFYDGHMEVVCATIPGKSEQEVVVVSHLCHPQPSANDNASGAAAALEAARALHQLIQSKKLEQPTRGIRFLWVPEFTGSYAYLAAHEEQISDMIAGINLDMVGGTQSENGSALILERPPDAASSFIVDVLEWIRNELCHVPTSFTGVGTSPSFLYTTSCFSGGSDHVVFSDPTIGVPMVMLGQWPDKFYHTSADTIDHIDPKILAHSSSLTAAFSYFVASAGKTEITWLAYEMAAKFEASLAEMVQKAITVMWQGDEAMTLDRINRQVTYQIDRYKEALASLEQLWDGVESLNATLIAQAIVFSEKVLARASDAAGRAPDRSAVKSHLDDDGSEQWEQQASAMVPYRPCRGSGPVIPDSYLYTLSPETRLKWSELISARSVGGMTMSLLADFWADGRRTVLDIIDLIEMETGVRDAELVVNRFKVLEEAGLVELTGLSIS
ncbi:MAG: DUF4910 domain-containing protein [Anaerolineales bacterium]|nr:DUF4910 domain-containing protein [Anaerolineales bacterium]